MKEDRHTLSGSRRANWTAAKIPAGTGTLTWIHGPTGDPVPARFVSVQQCSAGIVTPVEIELTCDCDNHREERCSASLIPTPTSSDFVSP